MSRLEHVERLNSEKIDGVSLDIKKELSIRNQNAGYLIKSMYLNHPLLNELKRIFDINYPLLLTTVDDISDWLAERGFVRNSALVESKSISYDFSRKYFQWNKSTLAYLVIEDTFFDSDGGIHLVDIDSPNRPWEVKLEAWKVGVGIWRKGQDDLLKRWMREEDEEVDQIRSSAGGD